MGQQQLLLIILGIIIVGIAVGIANNLFDTNAESSNKDSIASELINLGMLAQQYYNRPIEMGGGNQNYSGWQIPTDLDSTISGTYTIKQIQPDKLILLGTPIAGKGYNWYLKSTVTKDKIVTVVIN